MVVMVLIGIIASFAVVQIPSNDPAERIYTQARRLAAVLQQQWEEAILLGQQRGVRFQDSAYQVLSLHLENKKWLPPAHSDTSPRYELDEFIDLQLTVEGRPVVFATTSDTVNKNTPHIIFLSSGEATEFQLTLSHRQAPGAAYRLNGSVTGKVELAAIQQ